MDLESSPDLLPKNEENRPLPDEREKWTQNEIVDKRMSPKKEESHTFGYALSIFVIVGIIYAMSNADRVVIKKDSVGVKMDINNLTDTKKLSQFFRKHDINGDERLDGKELLVGVLHLYQDTLKKLNESQRNLSDSELSWMADFLLKSDGRKLNGSVSYSVLLPPKKKVSRKYSFTFKSSQKKKWCSAKTTYNRPKSVQSSFKTESSKKKVQAVKSPIKSPMTSPVKSPMKSPVKSPMKSPVKSPMKSPVKSPMKSPVKSPMKSPVKSPMKSPVKSKSNSVRKSGKRP